MARATAAYRYIRQISPPDIFSRSPISEPKNDFIDLLMLRSLRLRLNLDKFGESRL